MKRFIAIPLLFILTGLPIPVLAWPLTLHDDGGPYQALAVASAPSLIVSGVVTPSTIELTVVSPSGQRLGWHTIELPEEAWNFPRRALNLQLRLLSPDQYQLIALFLVGAPGAINAGYRYIIPLTQSGDSVIFSSQYSPLSLAIPIGASDAAITWLGNRGYLVWLTQDEDGIATVRLSVIQLRQLGMLAVE
jgi:hypothetical protein